MRAAGRVAAAAAAAVLAVGVAGAGEVEDVEDFMGTDPQVARVEVCYAFGCSRVREVYVFEDDWTPVAEILAGATSPADERRRIALAIGATERMMGQWLPTDADVGGNDYPGHDPTGQLDCVAESTNATAYLRLFEARGLLAYHRVGEREHRAPLLLDDHWTAVIEERTTGRRFAVDSWPMDNGEPAWVQPIEDWRRSVEPTPAPAAGTVR